MLQRHYLTIKGITAQYTDAERKTNCQKAPQNTYKRFERVLCGSCIPLVYVLIVVYLSEMVHRCVKKMLWAIATIS